MESIIFNALVIAGVRPDVEKIYYQVKNLMWEKDIAYVQLLSPISNGLNGRIASFMIAPDGWPTGSDEMLRIQGFKDELKNLVSSSSCRFSEVSF